MQKSSASCVVRLAELFCYGARISFVCKASRESVFGVPLATTKVFALNLVVLRQI